MTSIRTTPSFPPPSPDVRAEALARARELATGLFPHQVDGVAFLISRRRAILADDMGLGKTRQSIVALTAVAPAGPWLVIAPASVKRNWAREIGVVRPNDAVHVVGPADVPPAGVAGWVVVNYDLLARHGDALGTLPWTGMLFDEAHYLKNHRSARAQQSRALVDLAPDAVLYVLTGTPLTNRPRDLFPLLQLVKHPMGRSFLSFAKRYCAAEHNGFGWVTDGASNLAELREQLHGVMLRRTKDDVLDLPPKLRQWLAIPVPEGTARTETRKVMELLVTGALERTGAAAQPASARRPRTAGQDRVRLLGALTTARLQLSKAKIPTTIEFAEGVVAQGEKVIVFTAFDEPAQRIAGHFGEAAVTLTGRTPSGARQAIVDRFQEDSAVRVLVANIVAGGVGLNLTAARQVVFHDLDWVPANHWQAEDRAYRIGQRHTVNVTYMVGAGTLDEFVRSTLTAKAALVDVVVEGTGDATPDRDILTELEHILGALSPRLASLSDAESGEDAVDRLLREVSAAAQARAHETTAGNVGSDVEGDRARQLLARLPAEAIEALARALLSTGSSTQYQVESSSRPGTFNTLEVEAGVVTCSCAGFEYRGACRHARELQAALQDGGALPPGFRAVRA